MSDDLAERQLVGAELWERGDGSPSARFLAGWEDGSTFCAAVCSTDLGLAFCRACPIEVADRALSRRRASSARCPAGVRLLAFRVAPRVLRRAASRAEPADGPASLNAESGTPRQRAAAYSVTPREHDVLALVAEGLTNKEIGARLSISEDTVKKHVQNLIWKLRAADRTQAAIMALRAGLLGDA